MQFLLFTAVFAILFLFTPRFALAFEAELVDITPEAQDISDQLGGGDIPENIALFGFITTIDTAYTATFSVSECPVMVVTPGADLSEDDSWSCDTDSKELIVPFTAKELLDVDKDLPEGSTSTMIAFAPATEPGTDGPPEEMRGGWMSTNISEWELIPPSEDAPYFGYKLTGPEGTEGFFHMFIPNAIIELLSEFSGKELIVEDLAVFNGDAQASMEIEEVTGGALVKINLTFASNSTVIESQGSKSITKELTVREQLDVSLAAKKTSLKQGEKTTIYGWAKDAKKGEKVVIYRKLKGQKKFTKFMVVKTDKNGYFSKKLNPAKTATYRAEYKKEKSDTVEIVVKSKKK
ncbi:MAG: hypothetical protein A3E60_05280 [Candidatus Kerfeldbacteria bacterium RIFCSPHIGHO2_12_FULL_42_13]|nr:MAG: hypothetical protein A3E60_05280 [Candidatus Kerfeldbacteria bacterium RIFCSPHIGHO2_12_FULL_42_13]